MGDTRWWCCKCHRLNYTDDNCWLCGHAMCGSCVSHKQRRPASQPHSTQVFLPTSGTSAQTTSDEARSSISQSLLHREWLLTAAAREPPKTHCPAITTDMGAPESFGANEA